MGDYGRPREPSNSVEAIERDVPAKTEILWGMARINLFTAENRDGRIDVSRAVGSEATSDVHL